MPVIRREQMARFEQATGGATTQARPVDRIQEAIEKIRKSAFAQTDEGKKVLAKTGQIKFARMNRSTRGSWNRGTTIINDEYKDDPEAIASEIVYAATHAVHEDEFPASRTTPTLEEEMRSTQNQLAFYEEQRKSGFRDPELEDRRIDRAKVAERDRATTRSPGTPRTSDAGPMKTHVGVAEPILLLRLAARAMEQYRARTGACTREWQALDMTFANGPYRVSDPDVRPEPGTVDTWHPKNCEYSYRIAAADKDQFRLQAVNQAGVVVYEMERGMDDPRPVAR